MFVKQSSIFHLRSKGTILLIIMDALLSTLAFKKVPRIEYDKKRASSASHKDDHSKRPRILEDVLKGETQPSLVPTYTATGECV